MYIVKEKQTVVSDMVITAGSEITLDNYLPIDGSGWRAIRFILKADLTAGTGAGPVKEGLYHFVKNIYLKTSAGEVISPGVSGKALYYFNWLIGNVPEHDEIAAADGTYYAILELPFTRPYLKRENDLVIDTGRYSLVNLKVLFGTIADLLGTPGTASAVFSLSLEIEKTMAVAEGRSVFYKTGKAQAGYPVAVPYFSQYSTLNLASLKNWDIESSADVGYEGFLILGQSANIAPFVGTPSDASITRVAWSDIDKRWVDAPAVSFREARGKMKDSIYADTPKTGLLPWVFINEGSIRSLYPSGGVGRNIKLNLDGTGYADLLVWGVRSLR